MLLCLKPSMDPHVLQNKVLEHFPSPPLHKADPSISATPSKQCHVSGPHLNLSGLSALALHGVSAWEATVPPPIHDIFDIFSGIFEDLKVKSHPLS